MSEFKFIRVIDQEISAIKPPADALKEIYKIVSAAAVCGLNTSVKYIEQNIKIGELMDLYSQLVLKDVAELLSVIDVIEEMDENMIVKK